MSGDSLIPRVISAGDEDAQTTFAAIGYALTVWESCEDAFSHLYSLMEGNPASVEAYRRYGAQARSFAARAEILRRAGEAFFVKRCSQDNEGKFADLVAKAIALSASRNRIAHGMVKEIHHFPSIDDETWEEPIVRWHLNAPWFAEETLKAEWPGMAAREILIEADRFTALGKEIADFLCSLWPSEP